MLKPCVYISVYLNKICFSSLEKALSPQRLPWPRNASFSCYWKERNQRSNLSIFEVMQDSFSRMKFMKQKGLSRLLSRQNCAYVMKWNSFETNVKKRSLRYIWKYNFSRKLLRLIDHLKYNKLQTSTECFLTAFINNPKLWNKWAKIIGLEKLLKQIWKVSLKFWTSCVGYSS